MKKILVIISILLFPAFSQAAVIHANSSTGNDTTGDGSSGAPYATFHKAYTMASANDTINLTGTFTWTNAGETGDSANTGYTLAKNLTIVGQGASSTIIQAATASTTADRRVFSISSASVEVTIDKVSIRNGRITSGSLFGGGIYNAGILTVSNSEIMDNTNSTYFGGGIGNVGTTTIDSSFIYRNTALYAGGVGNIHANGWLVIKNSTISYNLSTANSGYPYGGGVMWRYGKGTLTNNTIVFNSANTGGGLHVDDAATVVAIKNNIIARNIARSNQSDINRSAGTITDNGYNIVGESSTALTATGDWTDTNEDGTFVLQTVGTTGTLNIDTTPGKNDHPYGIFSHAIYASSIAINAGDTAANGTTTIPSVDMRGASRAGATDIGAFEYNGTGLTVAEPTTQASSITFSDVQYNKVTVSLTEGNGSRRVVFMKQGNSGTASPVDGTSYTGNTIFGSGSQIGSSGWYAVYDGVSTSSIIVTGLQTNTAYIVQVFEYNGVGTGLADYITSSATNNPNTQTTYAVTTRYANYTTGNDSTGDGSSGNPYKTFTKVYTMAQPGDIIDLTGTFTLTNADETDDASVTGFTIAKELTIRGNGPANTIMQAAVASTTGTSRVFTILAGVNATTTDMMIRHGRVTGPTDSGGGISNSGILYINNVDFNNNISLDYFGGALVNFATTTIDNSSFTNNTADPSGGGISNLSTTAHLVLNNSTVAYNRQTATTAYTSGGGIGIRYGRVFITNSTIAYNSAYSTGSGIFIEDTTGFLSIVNTIVAKNTRWVAGAVTDFAKGSGATVTDSGHNIIGGVSGHTFTGFNTWLDTDLNGSFTQNNTSATGQLYLDTAIGYNNNPNRTFTLVATSSSSIIINNGTTTASTTVPTTDQRGATRNGLTDIGAFEYNGGLTDTVGPYIFNISTSTASATATITWYTDEVATSTILYGESTSYGNSSTTLAASTTHIFRLSGLFPSTVYNFAASSTDLNGNRSTTTNYTFTTGVSSDVTVPTVEVTLPTASAATSSTVTLVASSSDNVAVAGVRFYINGVAQGSEDTSAPYSISWNSTATSSGSKTVIAVARDTSNNYATSTGVSFTTSNAVTISSVTATTNNNTASISWTTNTDTSSRVYFGPTTAYGTSTIEIHTSPRVTSHTVVLFQMPKCAYFNYIVVSRDAVGNAATSSNGTFTTTGCVGSSNITATNLDGITTSSGGTLTNGRIRLTVPTAFTSTTTSATFQANKLDGSTFFGTAGGPGGKNRAGNTVFNLKALTDATTTLTSFTQPISITMEYEDADVEGIIESSLKIYRYDESDWHALSGCTVDTDAKTVTCTTQNFSDFALFGDEGQDESEESVVTQRTNKSSQTLINRIENIVKYTSPATVVTVTRDLEFGMSGDDVKNLQNLLIIKNTGPKARALALAGATGYFGPVTKAAVIEFQLDRAIYPPYGYFGPKTKATLQ